MSDVTDKAAAAAANPLVLWFGRALMGVVAFFAVSTLNKVEHQLVSLNAKQTEQALQIEKINGKVDVLDAKLDSTVVYQVDDLKKRIERLEAVTRVP